MSLTKILEEGGDVFLLEGLGWFLLALGVLLVLLDQVKVVVPYGKYSNSKGLLSTVLLTDLKVSARMGWFVMEMPSFVIPLYLVFNVGGRHVGEVNPNIVLLGMFILHYFNRYAHGDWVFMASCYFLLTQQSPEP